MTQIETITRRPKERRHQTPLLFQHGAWHGAWCWEGWLDAFADMGYETHALSLPAHGRSPAAKHINRYTLGDYVQTLARVAAQIEPAPALIGHSLGGAIIQKYLETYYAPVAVLLAPLPATGIFPMTLRLLRRHPWPTLKGFLTLDLYQWMRTPALVRSHFLSPDTAVDVEALQKKLVSESLRVGLQTTFSYARPPRTPPPMLVLAAEQDALFSVAEARKTAQKYGADFAVCDGQAHSLMMEPAQAQIAATIDEWLRVEAGVA